MGSPPDVVDVVARRRELLALLAEPRTKPDLVERADIARSTVDRAIDDLREHGLVSRSGSTYVATYAGRHAADAYDGFRVRLDALEAAQPILDVLPADVSIPPAALEEATVLESTPEAPQAPVEHNADLVAGATTFHGTGPAVIPQYTDTVTKLVTAGGATVELVLTEAVVEVLDSEYDDGFEQLRAATGLSLYVTDEPMPYAVWTAEKPAETVSGIVVYTDSGIKGAINNDTAAMNEWARAAYESYRASARPLD